MILTTLAPAAQRGLPPQRVPDPFGVNIHFVVPNEAEADALAAAGYRIIRMDFAWGGTERRRGEYDFSGYDKLWAAMDKRGIRCLFILDYANRLYDNDLAPHTDEGRAAFAKWAGAAARHFAGKGIIWELWNEPNLVQFWRPVPNAEDYAKLADAVIAAVRAADPDAFIVGPASSGFPWAFFETLADRGVLAKFDAISVHPYRQQPPETAAADYNRLRLMLDRASPKKRVPIVSGEWGYSTAWGGMSEEKQAQYIVRQWLFNMSQDIGLSIWYDWKDDGPDPKNAEHHFGSVYRDLKDKPTSIAARTLCARAVSHEYVRRLATDNPDDYLLVFRSRGCSALIAWTVGKPHRVLLPAHGEITNVWPTDGKQGRPAFEQGQLCVDLTAWPTQYDFAGLSISSLSWWGPKHAAPVVRAGDAAVAIQMTACAFTAEQGEFRVEAEGQALGSIKTKLKPNEASELTIPLKLTDRGRTAIPATIRLIGDGKADAWQTAAITLLVANSLSARLAPGGDGTGAILIDNPSGEELKGDLAVFCGTERIQGGPFATQAGKQPSIGVALPPPERGSVRVEATDSAGNTLFHIGPTKWVALPIAAGDAWRVWNEGDRKVEASASVSVADVEKPPVSGIAKSLQIDYRFGKGWRYVCIAPPEALGKIDGQPKELGMWVLGDGSGNALRCRFKDSSGQTFQATYGGIDWTGWKWITLPLDGTEHHWGGANDGKIHYPIRFDAVALIDNVSLKVDQAQRTALAGIAVRY